MVNCDRCGAPREEVNNVYSGLITQSSCLSSLGVNIPLCFKCQKLVLKLIKAFLKRSDDSVVDSMLRTMPK